MSLSLAYMRVMMVPSRGAGICTGRCVATSSEDFPDAEERRLLYVAITRAKHQVWLLQDTARPSILSLNSVN